MWSPVCVTHKLLSSINTPRLMQKEKLHVLVLLKSSVYYCCKRPLGSITLAPDERGAFWNRSHHETASCIRSYGSYITRAKTYTNNKRGIVERALVASSCTVVIKTLDAAHDTTKQNLTRHSKLTNTDTHPYLNLLCRATERRQKHVERTW